MCLLQAVLKRKTEEAEAARRKLRELTELQARVRRDKQAMHAAAGCDGSGRQSCQAVRLHKDGSAM
jgi:hypothetical protein